MSARPITPPVKAETLAKKQIMVTTTTSVPSPSISASSQKQTRQQKTGSTMTDEEKLALKRARNRNAAARSRHHKRVLIEDLKDEIKVLTGESRDLDTENRFLRLRLAVILAENKKLVLQRAKHKALVKSGGLDMLIAQSLLTKRHSAVPQGLIAAPLPKLDPLPLPPVLSAQFMRGPPGVQQFKYQHRLGHHT